jgi:small subunit ribosomal protein S1
VVTELVKGGLRVDVGSRAFMPASRSGAKDQAELEKLVGQEIQCRIIKLDTASEDVVVDRRVVLEEEEARARQEIRRASRRRVVRGTVRSLTDFGAFVDLGGVDGLLHVATWLGIAWRSRPTSYRRAIPSR